MSEQEKVGETGLEKVERKARNAAQYSDQVAVLVLILDELRAIRTELEKEEDERA